MCFWSFFSECWQPTLFQIIKKIEWSFLLFGNITVVFKKCWWFIPNHGLYKFVCYIYILCWLCSMLTTSKRLCTCNTSCALVNCAVQLSKFSVSLWVSLSLSHTLTHAYTTATVILYSSLKKKKKMLLLPVSDVCVCLVYVNLCHDWFCGL